MGRAQRQFRHAVRRVPIPFAPPPPGGSCAFASPPTGVDFQPYPSCRTQQSASFNQFTYNVDIDYHFNNDVMAYFAHRLGYRSGGFGTRAVNAPELAPFVPETVNDYELGLKATGICLTACPCAPTLLFSTRITSTCSVWYLW